MANFATVQHGEYAGELVRIHINPSINLIADSTAPRSPYVTGYGDKIPTRYRVRVFDQKWRRVYVRQYSNAGTAYVFHKGERVIVTW